MVAGGVVEPGERGVGDLELHLVRVDDDGDEDGEVGEHGSGGGDEEEVSESAAAAAVCAATGAPLSSAAGWDWRLLSDVVCMRLFLYVCHRNKVVCGL